MSVLQLRRQRFREQWLEPAGKDARAFEREAGREIGPGHALLGLRLRAVTYCRDCDAVAFRLPDGSYAIVELTWSRFEQEPAPWPVTACYETPGLLQAAIAHHGH